MNFKTTLVALLFFVTAPNAEALQWHVTLQGGAVKVMDAGLLQTTDTSWLSKTELGVAALVAPDLMVGLSYGGGGAGKPGLFAAFKTAIDVNDLAVTTRWYMPISAWLRPFVEGAVGASHVRVAFRGDNFGDDKWLPFAAGSVGLQFRLPPGTFSSKRVSLGLDVAGGYWWRLPAHFDDVEGADLGTLSLHGAGWRVGLNVMW